MRDTRITYRPDIDGLRAFAVIAIILFHAFPGWTDGFYVSVDVFFVISGYLITKIIMKQIEKGNFTIAGFYERRARRILPLLMTVIGATLLVGWLTLFPNEFKELGHSAIAATLFFSNFHFAAETQSYFADSAEYMPLLQTWTLSTEEQFYLVVPVLLLVTFKFAKRAGVIAAVGLICVASLAWSVYATGQNPANAYYSPFARAYTIGLGAFFALMPVLNLPRLVREALGFIGFAMILYCFVTFDAETSFPGYLALIPTLGTVFIIAAGEGGSLVSRVFSIRPLVFAGLISYSWYLWHWPFLAFARIQIDGVHLPLALAIALIAASFLTAILTYYLIEMPFMRSPRLAAGRVMVFAASVAALVVSVSGGWVIMRTEGFPNRVPEEARLALTQDKMWKDFGLLDCEPDVIVDWTNACWAKGTDPEGPFTTLIVGDSHAATLATGLIPKLTEAGYPTLLVTMNGCAPLLDVFRLVPAGPFYQCTAMNKGLIEFLEDYPEIETVIMHGRWAHHGEGHPPAYWNVEEEPVKYAYVGRGRNQEIPDNNVVAMTTGVTNMIDALQETGREVIIVGSMPEPGWAVPRRTARSEAYGTPVPPGPRRSLYEEGDRSLMDRSLAELAAEKPGVTYISALDALCGTGAGARCDTSRGLPLYADMHHLSSQGAQVVSTDLLPKILNDLSSVQ